MTKMVTPFQEKMWFHNTIFPHHFEMKHKKKRKKLRSFQSLSHFCTTTLDAIRCQLLFFVPVCVPRCGTYANQQLLFFWCVCPMPWDLCKSTTFILVYVSRAAVVKRHFLGNRGHFMTAVVKRLNLLGNRSHGSDNGQLSPH